MKKKMNFHEVNRAMRTHHKVNTHIVNFTSDDIEKAVTNKLEDALREKIKVRFAESPHQGGGTAEDVVNELLIEEGLKKPEQEPEV